MGFGVALLRGFFVPTRGAAVVLGDAFAPEVEIAEVVLGFDVVLLRGLDEPEGGAAFVFFHADAGDVEVAEVVLGLFVTLDGGFFVPVGGLFVVFFNAPAFAIHPAEVALGGGEALGGGFLVPVQRAAVILGDAVAVGVHPADAELGGGIALLGFLVPGGVLFGVVLFFEGQVFFVFFQQAHGLLLGLCAGVWLYCRSIVCRSAKNSSFFCCSTTGSGGVRPSCHCTPSSGSSSR